MKCFTAEILSCILDQETFHSGLNKKLNSAKYPGLRVSEKGRRRGCHACIVGFQIEDSSR